MRVSIMVAALAAGFLGATAIPAAAGPHDAEIEAILGEAADDWSVVLSCSILNPEEHATIQRWWADDLAELAPLLLEAGVAPKLASTLLAGLAPAVLIAPTEGDAATLIAFCSRQEDWRRKLALLTIVLPVTEIEQLIRP